MATSKSRQKAAHEIERSAQETADDAKQVTRDVAEYLKQYARENPGTAALWCLGIGFVLGWKMKPW